MKKRAGERMQRPLRVFVLDGEALSLAVRGDRRMIAWLDLAARGEAEVVTSPMTLVEAYDGRTTEQRWDWVLSRLEVAAIGKDEARQARQARRLLADAKLHGHKYAIDAVLAVVARRQKGQVTVFTSDVDDLEKLLPDTIVVKKV
ncbi:PIN domain-containing protein [Streptomyces sp. NPDC020996]|uniref:PIN domain-containing protein n=1 Tax=Streptomyces sp. NPDC020996 TaxID=3154791 RepID=UPI003411E136